jgi:hypothetical protein
LIGKAEKACRVDGDFSSTIGGPAPEVVAKALGRPGEGEERIPAFCDSGLIVNDGSYMVGKIL